MSDIINVIFQKQLTPDTVDIQFCSEWLKGQIRGLFAERDEARAALVDAEKELSGGDQAQGGDVFDACCHD